ncbi:glycosyltransferase [Piscinibacter koreensis]|uniref:Glycosyltransferase n=1 Tax=Piscinibacter koreensis TaxID=2742824 RepID=A0A7Y6NMT4_9BURK|nr:glycosyltransferase [Schlegelella koreensis]NUZ06083.1 glycosyltransferase [Schlegelella koreensis]
MRLLVIHQNFPGQFGALAAAWAARPGWQVRALARDTAPGVASFGALTRYRLASRTAGRAAHPYLRLMEAATLHGQAAARAMLHLRARGFTPDVIVAHPGWGESLYAKDVFTDARLVHYCEWYYRGTGADVGFDPEFPATFDDRARIRTWNGLHALNLTHCDAAVTPTPWQKAQHPAIFHPSIALQHEGIPTHELGPDANAALKLADGTVLKCGDPVITFVARNLEPYRGFHIFMRALEQVQRRHPTCRAVIVGGTDVSYGARPKNAANWVEHMLAEVRVDPARTHFVGRVPRQQFVRLMQVSAVHCYLTYPFVLSWSLLEAMACGALVVASDTAPLHDVIVPDVNGTLVNFFDVPGWHRAIIEALEGGPATLARRREARRTAAQYSQRRGLEGYDALIAGSSASRLAPTTDEPNLARRSPVSRYGVPALRDATANGSASCRDR